MRIDVAAASSAAIPASVYSGWGDLSCGLSPTTEPQLCAVSGRATSDGAEVIALVDAPAHPGSKTVARSALTFPKPRSMSFGAAAQLPFLVLSAAAALHEVGLPPGRGSVGTSSAAPATVVVAGSSGRLPAWLAQLLSARGARAVVAGTASGLEHLEGLGASAHDCIFVDHDASSFQVELEALDAGGGRALVDCIGQEAEPRDRLSASYVSAASPALVKMEASGALAAVRGAWQWWTSDGPPTPPCVWLADEAGAEAMREALALIERGRVVPPPQANEMAELASQYAEYINWARDDESGLRFGFPSSQDLWKPPQSTRGIGADQLADPEPPAED